MMNAGQAGATPAGASRKQAVIAAFALAAIGLSLVLRFGVRGAGQVGGIPVDQLPLIAALVFGGGPLVVGLLVKLARREFGSDLLAGISIVTAVLLREYHSSCGPRSFTQPAGNTSRGPAVAGPHVVDQDAHLDVAGHGPPKGLQEHLADPVVVEDVGAEGNRRGLTPGPVPARWRAGQDAPAPPSTSPKALAARRVSVLARRSGTPLPPFAGPPYSCRTGLLLFGLVVVITVGEGGPPNFLSQPKPVQIEFLALGLMLLGFGVGWVREGLGGLLVLLGLAAFNAVELAVNGRPALGAFPLFAVPGVLFLVSALLGKGQATAGKTLRPVDGRASRHPPLPSAHLRRDSPGAYLTPATRPLDHPLEGSASQRPSNWSDSHIPCAA
jgi:hypothetical protein